MEENPRKPSAENNNLPDENLNQNDTNKEEEEQSKIAPENGESEKQKEKLPIVSAATEDFNAVGGTEDDEDQDVNVDEDIDEYHVEEYIDEYQDEEAVDQYQPYDIQVKAKHNKTPLKIKCNKNGKLLVLHHTVCTENTLFRIPIKVCCFSEVGAQFVAIDKRGNIFVIDLAKKQRWKLQQPQIPKASVIASLKQRGAVYLVGTKLGHLLQLDVDKRVILNAVIIASDSISEISYPGQPLQPSHLALVHVGREAILVNLQTFTATHRLDFGDAVKISLKFASYMPFSEQIFTCFTNDSVHLWSGVTLNTLRVVQPIKARDRKIQLSSLENIPKISLPVQMHQPDFVINCQSEDYSGGLIISYCYQPNGRLVCLTTVDNFLLLLSSYTFELERIYRLQNFCIKESSFLAQPKEELIFGLTNKQQIIVLDCRNIELKMILQTQNACHIQISTSSENKLLAAILRTGEACIWSTSQLYNNLKSKEHCMKVLRAACKQSKPLAPPVVEKVAAAVAVNDGFNDDIKKMLKRERLLSILNEYGSYPAKYRSLIWCRLLKLPYNSSNYQLLLKMGIPEAVRQRVEQLKLKHSPHKNALLKLWSCLAHWCKVFAYSQFLPFLIFPFVKMFPKNGLVAFEVCATLLLNHFHMWFEMHPLEPANYLAMCENLLQYYCPDLSRFYAAKHVLPTHYAWALLSNCFSEVLDNEQWLVLWDNIVTFAPYLLIFCCIAYNLQQREVILRLPDKATISYFFHEQNPIDISKLISDAVCLMERCPQTLHPKRYIMEFQCIPKNVYPKFLNYPKQWIVQHEKDLSHLQAEQRRIDERIRQLELEEFEMLDRLERGLKEEEHAKRIKEMEKQYREMLQSEEERIACQQKLLLLYQKEIRNRKGEVIATLQESENRRKALEIEKDMNVLIHNIERERIRNDTNMTMAEDEIRNQDVELYAQKYAIKSHARPMTMKYYNEVQRVCREGKRLSGDLKKLIDKPHEQSRGRRRDGQLDFPSSKNFDYIEKEINAIQREFKKIITK